LSPKIIDIQIPPFPPLVSGEGDSEQYRSCLDPLFQGEWRSRGDKYFEDGIMVFFLHSDSPFIPLG